MDTINLKILFSMFSHINLESLESPTSPMLHIKVKYYRLSCVGEEDFQLVPPPSVFSSLNSTGSVVLDHKLFEHADGQTGTCKAQIKTGVSFDRCPRTSKRASFIIKYRF